MTRYTADGVAMARYLVDQLPPAADEVFERAEQVASADEQDLAVCGSLIDHHTMHDALLIANHRVGGTEAILTNDREFGNETTVWR